MSHLKSVKVLTPESLNRVVIDETSKEIRIVLENGKRIFVDYKQIIEKD